MADNIDPVPFVDPLDMELSFKKMVPMLYGSSYIADPSIYSILQTSHYSILEDLTVDWSKMFYSKTHTSN